MNGEKKEKEDDIVLLIVFVSRIVGASDCARVVWGRELGAMVIALLLAGSSGAVKRRN